MKLTIDRALAQQNEKIAVVLCCGSEKIELSVELRRAECTRAEILGRVGMIPMKEKGQRFTIKHPNMKSFLEEVNRISESKDDGTLYIECSKEDLEQFNLLKN